MGFQMDSETRHLQGCYPYDSKDKTLNEDVHMEGLFKRPPSNYALVKRIQDVDARCALCGELQESETHPLLFCPHANKIWATFPFANVFSTYHLCSIVDAVLMIQKCNNVQLRKFIAIIWSCWNSRNNDLFHNRILSPMRVITKALNFVNEFRVAVKHFVVPLARTPSTWEAPPPGLVKNNFDRAKLGEWGKGWGVVGRYSSDDILFSYVQQASGFTEAELEEANACLLALRRAGELSYRKIIIEGDCSSLITKLQTKICPKYDLELCNQVYLKTS
ncbi:hypothetical protein Cgig2_017945 [Carnegiea gigantea]|uniref:RNase H type-1 domain-containing protein n=1 Tax=Carnegiea gigantea TaxID=171969 RepID=A0A9Q1KAH0_9CARY|nr:hypothetical protein Cgig2_017945 [Carnegiea gigantea]